MTKNWRKITAEKKIKLFFGSKTTIYLSIGLHKERPSYRRSLQLSKKTWTFKKFFFFSFAGHFCPPGTGSGFRIRIRIHWPDWIRIQSGSGSLLQISADRLGFESTALNKRLGLEPWLPCHVEHCGHNGSTAAGSTRCSSCFNSRGTVP